MTHLGVALRLIENQERLLAAYRCHARPTCKVLDAIRHDKKWLSDAGLFGAVAK